MKEKEPQKNPLFDELNEQLEKDNLHAPHIPTVQNLAEYKGISENVLNDWLKNDVQFATELQRIRDIKQEDIEESYEREMLIFLLMIDTKERKNLD